MRAIVSPWGSPCGAVDDMEDGRNLTTSNVQVRIYTKRCILLMYLGVFVVDIFGRGRGGSLCHQFTGESV